MSDDPRQVASGRHPADDQARAICARRDVTPEGEPEGRSARTSPVPSAPLTTRRRLLKASLGGLATAVLAPAAAAAQPDPADLSASPMKVLVLGAGMAGLTAALSLSRRGHDVTVIEYQNRVGGRLLSVPLTDGQVSEAGGGHFRSNMPLVLNYIRRFQLPLVTMNDGLPRYIVDGKTAQAADLAGWPWALTAEERGVSVSSTLNRYLYLNGLDTETVLDPGWPDAETLRFLDGVVLGDLIRRAGGSEAFLAVLDAHSGTFTSRSPALGSVPDLAYHFGDQNLFRIRGGNDRLPRAMADLLGDRVVLDAPVTAIDQTGPRVKVTVRGGREFSGDRVISTIPFTVLRDVEVRPGWSAGKRRMFDEMEWDKTVKVIAQTRTPAWLAKGMHGWPMAGGDRGWERVVDITGKEPGGHGNAFFYLNGANAEAVLARPRETRAREVVDGFLADMPDLFDEVIMVQDFAWSEQPWVRASFAGPPVGGGWMIAKWTRPEDRVHLAGDFTSMKSGWVEGAIESGLRAARQLDPGAPAEGSPPIRQDARP
jgi:monoamine oxidase